MDYISNEWILENAHVFSQKKVVIIAGAGISVSSGIPDFRSKTGLFQDIKNKYKIKGEELFSYKFGIESRTRKIYLEYICNLKRLINNSNPSYTHKFFKWYAQITSLRVYTQNIDSLEEKGGLTKDNLVYLHGNLKYLRCLYCGSQSEFNNPTDILNSPKCTICAKSQNERLKNIPKYLHTNIIHYHQDHPDSDLISKCIRKDSNLDLLIVVGTSLNVFGVKNMVKYFSKFCKNRIFVSLSNCSSSMKKYFTHFYKGTSDDFFRHVKKSVENYDLDISLQDISIHEENIEKKVLDTESRKPTKKNILKKMKRLSLTKEDIVNNFIVLNNSKFI